MQVRALRVGFYPMQRRRKGDVFRLKKASDFSHIWMEALDFTPEAPSETVAKIMNSPEHKARDAEYKPFDKNTHPNVTGIQGYEDTHQPEEEEEVEAPKKSKKAPSELAPI